MHDTKGVHRTRKATYQKALHNYELVSQTPPTLAERTERLLHEELEIEELEQMVTAVPSGPDGNVTTE